VKLLFIHEVNWKTKPIFEIHDYPELLTLRGHSVWFLDFPEGHNSSRFFKRGNFATEISTNLGRAHAGSSVEVITPGKICGAPIDRLVHSLTFVPLLFRTIRRTKCDAVVLYGVPTNGWQTIIVAKLLKVPVLFRAIDVSHALRKTVFRPLIKIAEKFVYRSAKQISANNESLRDHCIKYGANCDNVSVDYPGLDLERFKPEKEDLELKRSLGLNASDKVVLFMGTLYRFAGLTKFVELMEKILVHDPKLKILILGEGEAFFDIKETSIRLGIESQVLMPGFINYDNLPRYLNLASISVNTFEPGLVTNSALPWKVIQYLACGLPTISTPISGLVAYTGRESKGIIYRNLDQSFIDAISELLVNHEQQHDLSIHARALVEERSSWSNCILRFEQILDELVAQK